jgi:hypothetical protein
MDDAEKIRNFDKLSFEEQCALTGQSSEDFLSDAFPLNTNLIENSILIPIYILIPIFI